MAKHQARSALRRSARMTLVLAALVSLVAACSVSITDKPATDGEAAGSGGSGSDGSGANVPDFSDVPVQGVSDDTLTIGAAVIDTQAVLDTYGVDIGNLPKDAFPALVEALNEAGGINGRQVELKVRYFMPIGNEPSETACRELIEDEQVFAVLGTFLADNPLCVTETHATPYIGLWGLNAERHARSQAPFLTADSEEEEGLGAAIDLLIEQGTLEGKKVGVYFERESTQATIDEKIVGPLEEAGVEVVGSAQLPESGGDAVQAGNEIDRILERFQSDGADTVIFASGLGVVMPALERTSWSPQLVFVNNGQIIGHEAVIRYGLTDPNELDGAIGAFAGHTSAEEAADEKLAECFATINEHSDLNVSPEDVYAASERPGSQDLGFLAEACRLWDFALTILTAAGDDPSAQSMLEGLETLDSFDIQYDADVSLSPERWGAKEGSRLWTFDVDEATFVPYEDQP